MARTKFNWALHMLDMFGLSVCCRNGGYFLKKRSDYVDLSFNPEIRELLQLESVDADGIISLARKLKVNTFTNL